MQITERQLDKYIAIYKGHYSDKNISREEALEDAYKLINLIKIILEVNNKNNDKNNINK